jgi:ribosomal protein S6
MTKNQEIEKKPYEITFVLKTEEPSIILQSLANKGFTILAENPLTKIRLAYPIKKESFAYFGYIHFEGEPKAIKDLRLVLKLNPKILRYLIITHPFVQKAVKKYEPAKSEEKLSVLPESVLTNEALEKKIKELV